MRQSLTEIQCAFYFLAMTEGNVTISRDLNSRRLSPASCAKVASWTPFQTTSAWGSGSWPETWTQLRPGPISWYPAVNKWTSAWHPSRMRRTLPAFSASAPAAERAASRRSFGSSLLSSFTWRFCGGKTTLLTSRRTNEKKQKIRRQSCCSEL